MTLMDVYLGSAELKRLIVSRSKEFNIPLSYICSEICVEYQHFMASYMNVQGVSSANITEIQFEEMLSILGISVRFQFVIDAKYDGSTVSDELGEKYENKKKFKLEYDKKRDITGTE